MYEKQNPSITQASYKFLFFFFGGYKYVGFPFMECERHVQRLCIPNFPIVVVYKFFEIVQRLQ
jgi:hypothetical protein